jgi:hypothetical protein
MGVKKEKQLWTSHRCFPGCVLEVVCLVRRTKYEMVAPIRKILDFSVFFCLQETGRKCGAAFKP